VSGCQRKKKGDALVKLAKVRSYELKERRKTKSKERERSRQFRSSVLLREGLVGRHRTTLREGEAKNEKKGTS